ncbi:tetratricopeptide repeat protein [Lacinutrix iliipiscaria]|uniref:Tetratricopeptide repeat protein n=1 Tax=Lacinutrix iliipiscaria TaxID=1230532 RepID=A0ABW5WLX9_9FLAO
MNFKRMNQPSNQSLHYLLFCLLTVFFLSSVKGQSTISNLQYNGKDEPQVAIIVTLPKGKPQNATVQVGHSFPSGTMFQVPAYTTVFLTSNNNTQRLGPGSKHMAQASPKGEKHKTFFGKVKHYVSNKLNFYKASGPNNKYQGAVEGTEFTVEAVGKDVKFFTSEGSVEIQRRVPVTVDQESAVKRKNERELYTVKKTYVNAGDPEMFYDYDAYEAPANYGTYQEAINQYQSELDQGYYNGEDPFYLADEYSLLGGLYLDSGNPSGAIEPLNKALNLWIEIDPYDPLIAEHYLNLAEAHYLAGNYDTGVSYWDNAVLIIDSGYQYYLQEFNYFYDLGDNDTAWGFGMDLLDMYNGLGYAYELRNNLGGEIEYQYQNPNYWYALADNLDSILAKL